MPRRSLLLLLLCASVLPACEGPRTVAGRIRDGAGKPVPHARLRTLHLTGEAPAAESDEDGRFRFEVFTSALATRASVQVDAAGYHPYYGRLPFRDDVEIVLVPDSVAQHGLQWTAAEWTPLAGFHYGLPLRLSYTFGIARTRTAGFDQMAGWYVAGEGGDGGIKGRAGFLRIWPHVGGQLGVAVLRTGDKSRGVEPDQTFAGAETRLHLVAPITFTIGGYARIAGSVPGDRRLISFAGGIGF